MPVSPSASMPRRDSGKPVLGVNAAAYTDVAAARAQWMLNAATEDGVHRNQHVRTRNDARVDRVRLALEVVQ